MHHTAALRWLEGDELHVTLHASPAEPALRTFVQPTPAPLTHPLDAELSHLLPPGGARTAVAGDVRRGAQGGWATPLVHPVLDASARQQATSELLLHEHATERVIEGLNSNLFVVSTDGCLHTASEEEGAYPGSVRGLLLQLAAESGLFAAVVEQAPTAEDLLAGHWAEAWLTCSARPLAPLARIWHPGRGAWIELPVPRGPSDIPQGCPREGAKSQAEGMRRLLDEQMVRQSEPISDPATLSFNA